MQMVRAFLLLPRIISYNLLGMGSEMIPEWFLDVQGKKVGPFTLEQVHGLLEDGEIRKFNRVTRDPLGREWITVDEALTKKQPEPETPPTLPGTEPMDSVAAIALP